MLHPIGLAVATSFALYIASGLEAQGLYWESTSTGGPFGDGTSKTYAAPKKFKMETGGEVMIFRLDQEKVYMVKPGSKTYSEMTFEEMEAVGQEMKAVMKKQLENISPEQRKAMEKQIGAILRDKPAKVDVEKTPEKKDIAGRSATKHVVKEEGKETVTLWLTDDLKEFKTLKADFAAVTKWMATVDPGAISVAAAAEKIDGFPLEIVVKDLGAKQTVTKVEGRSVADSEFEIPADFKKTPSMLKLIRDAVKRGDPVSVEQAKAKAKGKEESPAPEKKKE
jgi:uncharacterized protein DUF4412